MKGQRLRLVLVLLHNFFSDSFLPSHLLILFWYFQLDYIQRLMWQGQVQGNKTWSVAPVPECEHICHQFKFYVEPGDICKLFLNVLHKNIEQLVFCGIPKSNLLLTWIYLFSIIGYAHLVSCNFNTKGSVFTGCSIRIWINMKLLISTTK